MPVAAIVYISESNGAGEVVTDNISNINFGSVDQPNLVAASHPVIIGELSFAKYVRYKVADIGDSTTIKDFRIWKSAGAFVTGESIRTNCCNVADGVSSNYYVFNYATPVDTDVLDSPGNRVMPTADPGTANLGITNVGVNGNPQVPTGTITASGNYSLYAVYQTVSTLSTPVGPGNTKTLTFQYDET